MAKVIPSVLKIFFAVLYICISNTVNKNVFVYVFVFFGMSIVFVLVMEILETMFDPKHDWKSMREAQIFSIRYNITL